MSIEQSLISEIKGTSISELTGGFSELVLDSFLEEGLLRDIPIFGFLYKSYKGVIGIRDRLFIKKILDFLVQLRNIPQEKRVKFIEELDTSSQETVRVGQTLIMILDKLDDLNKSEVIGNLFKATVLEQLTYEDFTRLAAIVQRVYMADLKMLNNSSYYKDETQEHFASVGLLKANIKEDKFGYGRVMGEADKKYKIEYQITESARKIIQYGLEKKI
jgi:hypothetical protein